MEKKSELIKICFLMAVFTIVMLCFVPRIDGRPSNGGKLKQNGDSMKKLKFKEWINWVLSNHQPYEIEESRQSIAFLTAPPNSCGLGRNDTFSPFTSNASPIAKCIQACCASSNSVDVSAFHVCNRECMMNPHKYDDPGDYTGYNYNFNRPSSNENVQRRVY